MIKAFLEKHWEIILISLIVIIIGFGLKSCSGPETRQASTQVSSILVSSPTKQEVKDYNAKEVIRVNIVKEVPLGKKPEVKIIKTNDDKLLQVTEFKTDFGFSNKLGVWGGSSLVSLTGGIKYSPVFYSRAYLDLLAGWPISGAGINYQSFRNSFIGIGYGYDFKVFAPLPIIYASLNF